MAKDKNGREIQVGNWVQCCPDEGGVVHRGVVQRVFNRDLDDEPLEIQGREGTWPSSQVVVMDGGFDPGLPATLGMHDVTELEVMLIAQVAHEVNRAYCLAIGDNSQQPWTRAAPWQRDSAIAGVTCVIDEPAMTPEAMHAIWATRKEAEGWVYGPEKNVEAKTHPCLVPYDTLPLEQRVKDFLFIAVCNSMLGRIEDLSHVDGETVYEGGPAASPDGAIVRDGVPLVGSEAWEQGAIDEKLAACERDATWQDAFFLAHPDMPRYPADMISWLEAQRLDDLRAIANDLPISNSHDFSREELACEIYGCFFPTAPSDAQAPGPVEGSSVGAVEGEVVPPPMIIEEGAL